MLRVKTAKEFKNQYGDHWQNRIPLSWDNSSMNKLHKRSLHDILRRYNISLGSNPEGRYLAIHKPTYMKIFMGKEMFIADKNPGVIYRLRRKAYGNQSRILREVASFLQEDKVSRRASINRAIRYPRWEILLSNPRTYKQLR